MATATRSMFGPTKHKYLGKIVSLRTPLEAHASVRLLTKAFLSAKTDTKRLRVARATRLAGNRALVMSRSQRITVTKRRGFRVIAKIYGAAAPWMFYQYGRLKRN